MTAAPIASPSLRARLVWRVALPLVAVWALGLAATLAIASRYVQRAYDRALLDDAYTLAAQVQVVRGEPRLALTQHEIDALLFDQSERNYFALRRLDGTFIAGQAGLPETPELEGAPYAFADAGVGGRTVRVVALRRRPADPFVVVMAQTTGARHQLLSELLVYSAAVQVALLLLLAWWLRRAIGRQLQPLAQLQDAIGRRDADDLSPLPDALARGAETRDIAKLGGALNALLGRLEHSLAAQRQFSGNVAHELRTPLAGIRAQAEFALAQDDPAQWRSRLQGILRSEVRASRYVEQLLALARADEADAAPRLEPVALDERVRDALLRWLPRADAQGVDLGAEVDDPRLGRPTWVLGDATLVDGVLDNLLANALRHGRAEAAARVTVSLAPQGAGVRLCVADNGPGLAEDERARVQSRGAQGSYAAASGQGAGLGLAIVRRYADLLQGRFMLEAAPTGTGLLAALWLPLERA